MRLLTRENNFVEYQNIALQAPQRYQELWIDHLKHVLEDIDIKFEDWLEAVKMQDVKNQEVIMMILPFELIARDF